MVTQETYEVTEKPRRGPGAKVFGVTEKERETLEILLEVRTYAIAASRLGTSEAAIKQRMSRLDSRYSRAKLFCNQVEEWKRQRRMTRRKH
jgi:hypothetical protein